MIARCAFSPVRCLFRWHRRWQHRNDLFVSRTLAATGGTTTFRDLVCNRQSVFMGPSVFQDTVIFAGTVSGTLGGGGQPLQVNGNGISTTGPGGFGSVTASGTGSFGTLTVTSTTALPAALTASAA